MVLYLHCTYSIVMYVKLIVSMCSHGLPDLKLCNKLYHMKVLTNLVWSCTTICTYLTIRNIFLCSGRYLRSFEAALLFRPFLQHFPFHQIIIIHLYFHQTNIKQYGRFCFQFQSTNECPHYSTYLHEYDNVAMIWSLF